MTWHICLIGPAANVHLQRWAQALCDHGLQISLISTTSVTDELPIALQAMPLYSIPTATPGMRRRQRLATLLRGWARIPGLLAALKPDLVHLHSLPTPAATLFLLKTPNLVLSAWGSDVVHRDRRKARLYPLLLARAARLTATSRYLAHVIASYLHTPRPIDVVPFGVDPDLFTPASIRPARANIGTLRHLERQYGIDVLINSLPIIGITHPQVHSHIGGNGTLASELQQQVEALDLATRVHFHGRIAYPEVPRFLQSLAVFAMPSRSESFGVAALEAQACGLPVVASQVGGLPEVVADGTTGLLVPPDDPSALANAIIALLDDPRWRASMGRAGRQWVLEHYQWQASVEQMLHIYEQVVCARS
jgi:glycosyltransferase involved in cell wall biosynthesis